LTTAAIILAAGRGTRAGGGLAKQWRPLAGRTAVAHALDAFRAAGLSPLVLVIHPADRLLAEPLAPDLLVEGGATRAGSVKNALQALVGRGATGVLIHDGARPLVSPALIARMVAALDNAAAAAPALPVTDALWRGATRVEALQPRDGLWRAQTPQAFRFDAILAAHTAHAGGAADDVEVALAAGLDVAIVEGEEDNIKLTWPADFDRAERILRQGGNGMTAGGMEVRLGNGFDVHRFGPGDHLWLCGVRIPFGRGLQGHSDADVGMHALTDAIYGALADGDIGTHFPPSDPQWKGAKSHIFLRHAIRLARNRGLTLGNADVTLICEAPKIGPHAIEMRAALAAILGADPARVSVKATTSEKLGFTGRGEGIAALATATLVSA
jgi:2-C-methyl-D-erythritol 4-phosphate cytidylyltransferase / 2-C-methyl-D-erythritol 2,4-cyclodiphosphate synthase